MLKKSLLVALDFVIIMTVRLIVRSTWPFAKAMSVSEIEWVESMEIFIFNPETN